MHEWKYDEWWVWTYWKLKSSCCLCFRMIRINSWSSMLHLLNSLCSFLYCRFISKLDSQFQSTIQYDSFDHRRCMNGNTTNRQFELIQNVNVHAVCILDSFNSLVLQYFLNLFPCSNVVFHIMFRFILFFVYDSRWINVAQCSGGGFCSYELHVIDSFGKYNIVA